jgi:lipopolysaccharide biosynthesis glycosyltransferase
MNQNSIEIVFAATGDYAPFVATAALSIIENTNERVNFHVLTENFKPEDENTIKDFFADYNNVSFEFIDVIEKLKIFADAQLCWFKSHIPYARILIPEILPQLSKAIYMDIDIICNCNIKELWDIDFQYQGKEYALAAMKGWRPCDNDIKNLAISPEHKYFNNGVLILNCDKWRKDKIAQALLKIAMEAKIKFKYPTQDVFNICFDNSNYIPFDNAYNYQPVYMKHIDDSKVKIVHYTMDKPWNDETCAFSNLFWTHARHTPYYEFFTNKLNKIMAAKKNLAAALRNKIKN